MESIQNDLDLIRVALTSSLSYRNMCTSSAANYIHEEAAEHHEGGENDDRVGQGCQQQHREAVSLIVHDAADKRNNNGDDTTITTADRDTLELVKLREQVAALSAAELEKAQLEVELASKKAALRQSVQAQHALSQHDSELQEQLQQATCALQQKTEELSMWRERHRRLQREADMLQQELDTLAAQCDRLETAVSELREVAQRACSENDKLRGDLHELGVESAALRGVRMEYNAAIAREVALREELDALLQTTAESQAYFSAAKAEVEMRRCYWAAVQEEHEALRDALATAQETLRMWEARFLSECGAPPPSLPLAEMQPHEANLPVADVPSAEERSNGNEAGSDDESRFAALEAKIVDLALHLREQRAVAESAGECYATLAAAVGQEGRELLDARRTLVMHRPEWVNLTEVNEKLQAALLARESHVEALQELLVSLLDELTEQSLHCYELETQLTLMASRSATPNAAFRGTAPRRSTALQLLQKQQRQQYGIGAGK